MIKMRSQFCNYVLTCVIFLFITSLSYSQNQKGEFRQDIYTDDYVFKLVNSEVDFFTGCLNIINISENREVFSADSFYTTYNSHFWADMNNDGHNELILDLGTGATMYDYNMFVIFDFTKGIEPVAEIHNAELDTIKDEIPKIISYVRLSPAVMGAGYNFSLKYDDGKMVLEKNVSDSKVLKGLEPDGKEDFHLIEEYKKGFDECDKDSEIKIYFEAFLMQEKIVGQEKRGWKFFDRHYKCDDKKGVRNELKKIIKEDYSYISNPDNYKFNLNKY